MERFTVYLTKEELVALRKAAVRSGQSISRLVRTAVRAVLPKPNGLVAIWDGELKRTSVEHDSIHDEP